MISSYILRSAIVGNALALTLAVACGGGDDSPASNNGTGGQSTTTASNTGGSTNTSVSTTLGGTNGQTTSSNAAISCINSGSCAPPFPYCDPVATVCVECLGDANCADGNRNTCDPTTHQCVECTTDVQCGGDTPYCSQSLNCVACLSDGNCGTGQTCDTVTYRCATACASDAICNAQIGTPYCDPVRTLCVECLADGNCAGTDNPYCLSGEGQCVECVTDANCGNDKPYCGERNRCIECLTDTNCPQGMTCDPRESTCQG